MSDETVGQPGMTIETIDVQPVADPAPAPAPAEPAALDDAQVMASKYAQEFQPDPDKTTGENFEARKAYARSKLEADAKQASTQPGDMQTVPYARFKEDREAHRQEIQTLQDQVTQLTAAVQAQNQPAQPAEPERPAFDYAEASAKMAEALESGNSGTAVQLQMAMMQAQRDEMQREFNQKLQEAQSKADAGDSLSIEVNRVVMRHPELNSASPQYNQELGQFIVSAARGHEQSGMSSADALKLAEKQAIELQLIGNKAAQPAGPQNPLHALLQQRQQTPPTPQASLGQAQAAPPATDAAKDLIEGWKRMDPDEFDKAWTAGAFNKYRGDNL